MAHPEATWNGLRGCCGDQLIWTKKKPDGARDVVLHSTEGIPEQGRGFG